MIAKVICWFDLTTAIAIAGFALSLVNAFFNWQGRKLAREQEKRRNPHLVPSLTNGYFRTGEGDAGRVYAFLIMVANPTDSNNAIVNADLAITFLTKERLQMTLNIRSGGALAVNFVKGQGEAVNTPISIAAHNAISGWACFYVPSQVLLNREIESYRLIFTDTHGEDSCLVPILVQEYHDET